jgi:phosphatidate phosphatase APP1
VFLNFHNLKIKTKTLDDGYFKFCIPLEKETAYGWIDYQISTLYNKEEITEKGTLIRPFPGKLGFISDIDDTFLVSHTHNIFKKLYILLFRNVYDRTTFKDVTAHYRALSTSGRNKKEEENAFFYVSSSEWNLYRFIVDFTKIHDLPRAVLLLKNIKTGLTEFLFSGRGNHNHKFEKIRHILEFYPKLHYTLLGDDSQDDPHLYESICKIFPLTVKAVYIRQTGQIQKKSTLKALKNLEDLHIAVCYFRHSKEAIAHSKSIGLIDCF